MLTLTDEEIRSKKSQARVMLTQAADLVFKASQALDSANPRRFEQTALRKDLVSVERKLTKLQMVVDDLDL